MILIFVSFENKNHASKAANYLIDKKLAACVTVFPVQAFYHWKGKKQTPKEYEAVIKTTKENFVEIEKAMKKLLKYEVPQLISIEAKDVNYEYLNWLERQVK